MRFCCLAAPLALFSAAVAGQVSSNQSLNGSYYFRHLLLIGGPGAAISSTQTAWGTLVFDGAGQFTVSGQQLIDTSPAVALSGSGTYAVLPGGFATLSSPQRLGTINARLGTTALVGSTTETASTFDLFIAIPAAKGISL